VESPKKIKESLLKSLGERVKFDFPLAPLTSFRIGGPADVFFEAHNPAELIRAILLSREMGIDRFVLGGGYNVLVSDRGFRGLVIKNSCLGFVAEGEEVGAQSGFLLEARFAATPERSGNR
jgi:UDP-N-acetylmuramate dehydrogenase